MVFGLSTLMISLVSFYFRLDLISYPLCILFRSSLDEGIFPSILKINSFTPISKSGSHSIISNYRQISVQSHITKIFKTHKIIIEEQHGFCSGRSTTTSNLVFSNYICESFQLGSQVDIVYKDLIKHLIQ